MHISDSALRRDLEMLTVKEILARLQGVISFSREERSKKDALIQKVLNAAPPEQVDFLVALGSQKRLLANTPGVPQRTKRRRVADVEESRSRRTRRRTECPGSDMDANVDSYDPARFLDLPPICDIRKCYRAFYEATSSKALLSAVCGVCARECGPMDEEITELPLNDIPNAQRLVPQNPHPQHKLYEGKLLEPAGVHEVDGLTMVNLCMSCLQDLRSAKEKPPQYSLANGLWIGPVPWQLQILTFSEQLLIALLYPRVFVFKLFPKKIGGVRDVSACQRAMRGNVSTYALDMKGIASMIEGSLMPRPPAILASLISITFIGVGQLPKRWLHSIFRIRRTVVFEALRWLKENNSVYYGDIEISAERIQLLPEDDLPQEVESLVRQTTEVEVIDQESDGYVPDSEQTESARETGVENSSEPQLGVENGDPDVIPLQVSGVVDTDLTNLTTNELMAWGLANLWKEGKEGSYAVRHGLRPVNDFGQRRNQNSEDPTELAGHRDNFFEKAFPCLYPYGVGGIEDKQAVELNFLGHVRWSLRYHDRRFRTHETFPFVAFGIFQRRQALHSARLQMRRKAFEKDAQILSTLTKERLQKAQDEEDKNLPFSDPAVRLLRKYLYATGGNIVGSDQSRYRLRSQIWSTSIFMNPPSLWITINPCDLHDPIAQVFAGEKINMDALLQTIGPCKEKRAQNIASDPYAAAKFFHFTIQTIFHTLFGIKVTPYQVKSSVGVFGRVKSYFGTVESQGRGSLHLHLLVWLDNTPPADEMEQMLKSADFREKVSKFISANIRAYLPGLESAESAGAIPNSVEVAWSRPPNPDAEDYDEQLTALELQVARAKQTHTCEVRRCLVPTQSGHLKCKRRAPFPILPQDTIDELGNWGPKRLYGLMNNWVPSLTVNVRCNNDGKLLTSGRDTKNVTFYVTLYAAKKQGKNHNMSAILARGFAYHAERTSYTESLRDQQRLLLFRLIHTINREQELAGPMVISYLMGWGDTYVSHHYTLIYWSSFVGALLRAHPILSRRRSRQEENGAVDVNGGSQDGENGVREGNSDTTVGMDKDNVTESEDANETVTLDIGRDGHLYRKCQVTDYVCRGNELEDYNVISFFVDTYEADVDAKTRAESISPGTNDTDHRTAGRPRHARIHYLPSHPKYMSKQRIARPKGHNNLPNFIGQYFPRRDDPDGRSYYHACMLVLLKPWRNLDEDLKHPNESWETAFNNFLSDAPQRIHHILAGIQYFHDCESAAQQSSDPTQLFNVAEYEGHNNDLELGEDVPDDSVSPTTLSEEGLENLLQNQGSPREELHARIAVETARNMKIFREDEDDWIVSNDRLPAPASANDIEKLLEWKEQMVQDVNRQSTTIEISQSLAGDGTENGEGASVERVQILGPDTQGHVTYVPLGAETSEDALPPVDPSMLKDDQFRAYDIVTWHLDQTLSGANIPPLRMLLHGEGGTGKSKVIQTITEYFQKRGVKQRLLKAAYTGVAASLIEGKTTHTIAMVNQASAKNGMVSAETRAKLQQFWKNYTYLVIDEISMIGKTFLALLSRMISIGKSGEAESSLDQSFGGVSVIICGDFHQFPPVAGRASDALYFPANLGRDTIEMQLGRKIFEEFTTIVTLKEQVRCTDPIWHDFLQHLRYGHVQERHVKMLRTLVLGNPTCSSTDFAIAPWNDASLVTPRHAVRKHWNDAALRKHCHETGQRLFICPADDKIKGKPLTLIERYAVAMRGATKGRSKAEKRQELPDRIEVAIGMKVMVTFNVQTDLDITNGARGTVVDIILDPEEPPLTDDCIVTLKHPPSYILVKLSRTRANRLEGLEESVIPVEPIIKSFQIKLLSAGKELKRTVRRRQFPMTAAYGFTDYRSQGQTIPYAIVDIAAPPTGTLSLFNLYVALSRSSGRSTIRLLRDFDNNLFQKSHAPELLAEDDRLKELDQTTKIWWQKMGRDTRRDRATQ